MSIDNKDDNVLPFEGAIKGYTIKFLKSNEWKVADYMEFSDLMQEAYAIYLLVVQRYSAVVDSPAHFMAFYKSSLRNKIIDMAAKATDHRKTSSLFDPSADSDDEAIVDLLVGREENEALFDDLIDNAPVEVKSVLNYVLQPEKSHEESQEFWAKQERVWKAQGKKKFLGNEYLCGRLGYDPQTTDLVGLTYAHFNNAAV